MDEPYDVAVDAWIAEALADHGVERTIDVQGAAVAMRGWGLEHTERPGLVLLHGFQAHARWWDHLGPRLARRHRVVAMDFTGFGDSAHRARYSRSIHADEVLAVMAELGFDRPAVIAHSYGAMVTMELCLRDPGALQRAVLVEPWVRVLENDGAYTLPQVKPKEFPDLDAATARFRLTPSAGWPVPSLLAHIARHSFRRTDGGWTFKFDPDAGVTMNEDGSAKPFRNIEVPLDFVHGDRSDVVMPDEVERLGDILPACGPPVSIPLAHHHILLEQPGALLAALEALLAVPRGTAR